MTIYEKLNGDKDLIVGVGSALIDILTHESEAFVVESGAIKGGMKYVEKTVIDYTIGKATLTPTVVPGGSACNTMVGIGRLGGRARFVGKCGNGSMGALFRTDLRKQNVEPVLFDSDAPTGCVLSIITPDAQRSMLTFLGASAQACPDDITPALFEGAAIVHIEGYLLFNRDLIRSVCEAAVRADALISLDLASHTVVGESRDYLKDLVSEFVDILIANEDEARAYTDGIEDEARALDRMAANVDLAVLKLGARGSLIARNGDRVAVKASGNGTVTDTTGAGDLWASGFLYGLVRKWPMERCGALGSICGYEVCRVMGANIPDNRWQSIRKKMEEQWPPSV